MFSFKLKEFSALRDQTSNFLKVLFIVALFCLIGMTAYENIKHVVFPNITIWESHIITILFSTLVCTTNAYCVLCLSQKWQTRLINESIERQEIEKVLRASEQRYRELFENANDIVYTLDFEGKFTSLNKAGERIFGYTQEEAVQLNISQIIAPEHLESARQMIKRELKGEPVTVYEIEAFTKDKQRVSLEVSTRIIKHDGKVIGIQGISRNITKRKQVESELRESEEKYRFLADSVPQQVWTATPDGRLDYGNFRTVEYFGKKDNAEFLGMEWLSVVHPDDRARCIERWTRALETGELYETEFRLCRFDGEYRWHLAQAVPMSDSEGKIIQWFGTNTDIHDRKQVENELRKSQQTLQLVVDTIPFTIMWKDRDSVYLGCNQHFARIAGYQHPSEVVGKNDYELPWKKEESDFFRECDRRVMETGVAELKIVEPLQHADKSETWAETNKAPLRDENGDVFGVLGTFEDITERKQAEEEKDKSQKMMQLIIDAIPHAIFWKDRESIYLGCNKHFAQIAGFGETADLIGKTDYDLPWKKEESDLYRKFDQRVMKTGDAELRVVESHRQFDEAVTILETNKIPLKDLQGNVIGVLSTSEDITARLRSEEERKQLEEQLRQAQKLEAVGQLAAGVAHEINTPLQYVGDNAHFLKESFQDLIIVIKKYHELFEAAWLSEMTFEQINELDQVIKDHDMEFLVQEIPNAVEQSLDGIERVTEIVQSMKDFAHPGTTDMKPVDLNKSIESTITVARNEWKYVAEMETDFDLSLPLVNCAIGEINQVILNMIINAAHAIADVVGDGSEGKGRITIKTSHDFDMAEIRISDTGGGIPVEARSKIFDLFFTTKEVGRGTGQGLAISHQAIVGKHNGNLTFETESGRGTTFIIRLPINQTVASKNQFEQTEITY